MAVWASHSNISDNVRITALQGTKVLFAPSAESDIQVCLGVTPRTVHQMIVRLEQKVLIKRLPWQARTIEVLSPCDCLRSSKKSQLCVHAVK